MALWRAHSVIGTKAFGLSLTKPNRFCQHDQPITLHTLATSRKDADPSDVYAAAALLA